MSRAYVAIRHLIACCSWRRYERGVGGDERAARLRAARKRRGRVRVRAMALNKGACRPWARELKALQAGGHCQTTQPPDTALQSTLCLVNTAMRRPCSPPPRHCPSRSERVASGVVGARNAFPRVRSLPPPTGVTPPGSCSGSGRWCLGVSFEQGRTHLFCPVACGC